MSPTRVVWRGNSVCRPMQLIEGRWRIVETELWDQEALDLTVPAHISLGRNGLGEMQLIAIGASIDYRVEQRGDALVLEFSWSGFDEMDATSGRAWARTELRHLRNVVDRGSAVSAPGTQGTGQAPGEAAEHRVR